MFWATKGLIVCFLGINIILLGGVTLVHALTRSYKFELASSSHTRICTKKTILTVNGQLPGPTIYARRGDLVVVDVTNRAHQNITIHWHGVKMPRNPWSDGTEYVTQCPITHGTRFRQRIILSDEEGTLWWHAHSDWSRNSVHGAIIILPPKNKTYPFPKPHAHVPILLGEWWKDDVQHVMEEFLASGGNPRVADAVLINGQPGDLYPCSAQDTFKLRVEFGKTYMLRLINTAMDNILFFRIIHHQFTVVGTDAAYTKPLRTEYVAISPGQTMDLLLETNQQPSLYYMGARVLDVGREYVTIPTTGIIQYDGNYQLPLSRPVPSFPEFNNSAASADFTNKLRSLGHNVDVPKKITEKLFFTLSMNVWPCSERSCAGPLRQLASVNNVSMLMPTTTDILDAYYRRIRGVYTADFPDFPPVAFDYTEGGLPLDRARTRFGTAVKYLEYNSAVEVVFQGTDLAGGVDHPMHLHGYSFYVVGSGFGNFDGETDPPKYNLVDPPLVENIAVPRNGWTAIRFKANNPGVWFMHCHLERHLSWGMGMVFIVKDGKLPNEKMLPPPSDMPSCTKLSSNSLQFSDQPQISNPVDHLKRTNTS